MREQGWALVDQELERGLTSLAAPIGAPGRPPVAALNVSTATIDGRADLEAAREPLLATAAAIGADLAAQSVSG